MIRYVTYKRSTGEITGWGYGASPPEGRPYVEYDGDASLSECRVDRATKTIVPKTEMNLGVPVLPVADGETEAVISGLPVGTVCEFYLDGELQRLIVTDGTLELVFVDPVLIRVTFWHPLYRHDPVEIQFV